MAKKQTAGRDRLGELAPKFAELNDDILFGEVWSREEQLSARDRSMITIAALFFGRIVSTVKISFGTWEGTRDYQRRSGGNRDTACILLWLAQSVEYISDDSGSI